jgi:hypothetical protein
VKQKTFPTLEELGIGFVPFSPLEPGSGFVFPDDELPEAMSSSNGTMEPVPVPVEEFEALTRVPIIVYYGDNIPTEPTDIAGRGNWRVRQDMARIWIEAINRSTSPRAPRPPRRFAPASSETRSEAEVCVVAHRVAAQQRATPARRLSMANSRQRSSGVGSGTRTNSTSGRSRSAATKRAPQGDGNSRRASTADSKPIELAKTIGTTAKKAKGPAAAAGAAAVGLAAGTVLGSKLQANRRSHVLGIPLPRGSELKSGAKHAARAGQWIAEMQADIRAVRAQAEDSRRQSPIEVLLSGLTSRRLPRHD